MASELGDLLFAVANWARHLGVGPEEALREATSKFERRFGSMEAMATRQGLQLQALDAATWDEFWKAAKILEQGG